MTRAMRGMEPPTVRSRDFTGSAIRLVKRLTPQRSLTALVIALAVGGRPGPGAVALPALGVDGLDPVQRLRAIDSLAELEDLTPEHTRKSGDIRLGRSLLLVMPKTILQVLAKARQAHRKARPEGALSENEAIRGLETSLVYGLLGWASGSIPMGVSFEDLLSLVHNWAGQQQSAAMDRLGL